MKKVIEAIKGIRFYFDGCDADLNGLEFLGAVILGAAICAAPFAIKAILLAVHFGGV